MLKFSFILLQFQRSLLIFYDMYYRPSRGAVVLTSTIVCGFVGFYVQDIQLQRLKKRKEDYIASEVARRVEAKQKKQQSAPPGGDSL